MNLLAFSKIMKKYEKVNKYKRLFYMLYEKCVHINGLCVDCFKECVQELHENCG